MQQTFYLSFSPLIDKCIIYNQFILEINDKKNFEKATEIFTANEAKEGVYNIKIIAKRRYINPLVKQGDEVKRIADISPKTKEIIDKYFEYDMSKYVYSNFDI